MSNDNVIVEKMPLLFNSRIIKLYVTYLNTHYPKLDLNKILRESRISKLEIEDPGHWFNQEQVDSFHQIVLKATGNPEISREAGRFCASSTAIGAAKQYALGLLNASSIYLLLPKLYSMFSKSGKVHVRKISSNRVEITVSPINGSKEKAYQCENRLGFFESLSTANTDSLATIEHEECIHNGAPHCRYVVSWDESLHSKWGRYFKLGMGVSLFTALLGSIFLPFNIWSIVIALSAMVLMSIWVKTVHLEKQELIRIIQTQGNAAEDHIKEIDYRYRGLLLVQRIGQATSELMEVEQLTQEVMRNIQHYLDFDRGIIMLADKPRLRLVYSAGYGFDDEKIRILKGTRFHLDKKGAKSVFVQTFMDQRPILVEDVNAYNASLPPRGRSLAQEIGSQSLIVLPIVHKGQSFGVLAVDNINGKRQLTQSDMNLLMGVASQTAVSIFSAMAQKSLQDSEERYRSLYDNAPTAYFSINIEDSAILNCNLSATRLLGYSRSRLLGSSWIDYFSLEQGNRKRAQLIQSSIRNGLAVHNEEVKLVCNNGKCIWANLSMEPFKDSSGRIVEGRCILNDISERKKLEEKLRQSQRLETIGTLAGGVAHDLSNILAAIVSYPDILLMDVSEDSPLFSPLNKIRGAGIRAAAIVQDLLTLARLGLHFTEVMDVNNIVEDYLDSPEHETLLGRHAGITIHTHLDNNLFAIKGSGVHLIKTLMNVVLNAAEAMPDGGDIIISTQNYMQHETDHANKREKGQYVVVSIKDNGTGIPKEDIDHIFEPFFTKKVMGRSGTGLGMAIVWATVQDHKGFIEIESQVGKGTTVHLFFPATNEVRVQQPAAPIIEEMMGKGEKLLIVDDEAEHRDIATHMLARLGYDVVAVDNAQDALDQVKKQAPDLLVLDMVLGSDLDGLGVYQRVISTRPGQKAVIISGFSETSRVKQALELGAGAYINKPYGLKEIAMAVRQELDR